MMRQFVLGLALLFVAGVASAQQRVSEGNGAVLRVLDKTAGLVQDVTLSNGQLADMGLLQIKLDECRYPSSNASGNAYAHLQITYGTERERVFDGWMIAAAPALNAMDHPRFDVWVLNCTT